jgi:hypothetical protein
MKTRFTLTLIALSLPIAQSIASAQGPTEFADATPVVNPTSAFVAAAVVQNPPAQASDSCLAPEVAATPTRPNWSTSAQTTQCNVVEFDSGWLRQPMGHDVDQTLFPSSMRYGLTPKMDLRWGMLGPIVQSGGGEAAVHGVTDQWFSARYRFLEQSHWTPALALSYGIKEATGNPAKGFGSGYADHNLIFIASRDFGRAHFDFNTVGILAGSPHGEEGAAQYGLALSVAVTKKFAWMLESDGGAQPGTSDRYGAALTGGSYTVRPWLVVDGAYTRVYTDCSPHALYSVGFTFARRSPFAPIGTGSRLAHWLGR